MFRKMMGGAAVAVMLLSAGMASAQDFSAAQISDGIRAISTDEFQGRYPGTEGQRHPLAFGPRIAALELVGADGADVIADTIGREILRQRRPSGEQQRGGGDAAGECTKHVRRLHPDFGRSLGRPRGTAR